MCVKYTNALILQLYILKKKNWMVLMPVTDTHDSINGEFLKLFKEPLQIINGNYKKTISCWKSHEQACMFLYRSYN